MREPPGVDGLDGLEHLLEVITAKSLTKWPAVFYEVVELACFNELHHNVVYPTSYSISSNKARLLFVLVAAYNVWVLAKLLHRSYFLHFLLCPVATLFVKDFDGKLISILIQSMVHTAIHSTAKLLSNDVLVQSISSCLLSLYHLVLRILLLLTNN